jgi:FtsZ-binding cell division protein ZapB
VDTITSQDSQISVLQAEIQAAAEKNARMQQELQQWAAKCVDELREESNLLKKKLEQSQQQLRNFTFNIQVIT